MANAMFGGKNNFGSNYGSSSKSNWRNEKKKEKDPNAMDIDAMSTEKRTYLMKKGLCFICEKSGHLASAHKDKGFDGNKNDGNKGKGKEEGTSKKKDIRKLHAYLRGLSKEETQELIELQNKDKEKEKDEDSDSDF
jgi:hypothetical protein